MAADFLTSHPVAISPAPQPLSPGFSPALPILQLSTRQPCNELVAQHHAAMRNTSSDNISVKPPLTLFALHLMSVGGMLARGKSFRQERWDFAELPSPLRLPSRPPSTDEGA